MKNHEGFCVLRVLNPLIQRRDMPEQKLQMRPDIPRVSLEGGRVHPEVESAIHQRAPGGGKPLERHLKEQMGASLGHDFSDVRVHTGAEADDLNRQLSARAFTVGSDIFFQRDAYDPDSPSGRKLIAHELIHVLQQHHGCRSKAVSGLTVHPAGDEFEREAGALAAIVAGTKDGMPKLITPRVCKEKNVVQRALETRVQQIPSIGAPLGIPGLCHNGTVIWLYEEAHGAQPDSATLYAIGIEKAIKKIIKEGTKVTRSATFMPGDVLVWVADNGEPGHSCIILAGARMIGGYNNINWFTPSNAQAQTRFSQESVTCIIWSGKNRVQNRNKDEYKLVKVPSTKAVDNFDTR